MARSAEVSRSTSGASAPIALSMVEAGAAVGFGVVKTGTGDITFTVQHTFHDLTLEANASAVWFDHSTVSGKTASIDGSYLYPINGIRLNIGGTVSGASVVTLHVMQSGR